jgi:hypothetical protein
MESVKSGPSARGKALLDLFRLAAHEEVQRHFKAGRAVPALRNGESRMCSPETPETLGLEGK